jgi:hypothetical protein
MDPDPIPGNLVSAMVGSDISLVVSERPPYSQTLASNRVYPVPGCRADRRLGLHQPRQIVPHSRRDDEIRTQPSATETTRHAGDLP